jgi:hypothetical protein
MIRMKNNRGQMRIIETILAAIIIVSALAFVNFFSINPSAAAYEVKDLEKIGYSILNDLDQQGILASKVYQQSEWVDLKTALRLTLPVDVYFNLTICRLQVDDSLYKVGESIRYGDLTTFSDAKNVASVSYSLVGTSEVGYEPRLLVLQLTRG